MIARPHRMRRAERPSPGRRAAAVMLLILLAAVGLFAVDRNHHDTVAHTHHVTAPVDEPRHHAGEPGPVHGHQHEPDLEATRTPRARLTVHDATVAIAAAVERVTDARVRPEAGPAVDPDDVDLHLLVVLRV